MSEKVVRVNLRAVTIPAGDIVYRCSFCKRDYKLSREHAKGDEFLSKEMVTALVLRGATIMDNRCMDCFVKQECRGRHNSVVLAGRK